VEKGGLRVKDLQKFNYALLAKWGGWGREKRVLRETSLSLNMGVDKK